MIPKTKTERHLLLGLTLASVVCCAALLFAPLSPASDTFAPKGYLKIVRSVFIANQWLKPQNTPNGIKIGLDPAIAQDTRVKDFFHASYLSRDADDPHIWSIRNNVVTDIGTWAHSNRLPADYRPVWEGAVLFRSDEFHNIALVDERGGTVQFKEPPFGATDELPEERYAFQPLDGSTPEILELYDNPNFARAEAVIAIRTVDHEPIVLRLGAAHVRVEVAGHALRNQETMIIPPGGTLVLDDGSHVARFERPSAATTPLEPSVFRRWGKRQHNPDTRAVAEAVERAMNAATLTDDGKDSIRADVRLTLDRKLQHDVNADLARFIEGHRQMLSGGKGPVIAAVTVMDALSGQILALASYPTWQDEDSNKSIDEMDYNFRRLAIGSAAKPILSSLILDRRRDLWDLEIKSNSNEDLIRTLLGTDLPEKAPLHDHPVKCDCFIDYDKFIEHSSNKYAALLMLLATAPPHGQGHQVSSGEGYKLGGVFEPDRPLSIFESIRSGHAEFSEPVVPVSTALAWSDGLVDVYDVGFDRLAPDQTFDTGIWQPLLNQLPQIRPIVFFTASPERENFDIDQARNFRGEVIPLILGGGGAPWTNIKLAQSYARLVTGRKIDARLALSAGGGRQGAADLALPLDLRKKVTHAMTLVALGGTASSTAMTHTIARAKGRAGADVKFGLFSKTGTPEMEVPIYNALSLATDQLVRLHRLRFDHGQIAYFPGGGDRMVPLSKQNRLKAEAEILADKDAFHAIALLSGGKSARRTLQKLVLRLSADNGDPIRLATRYLTSNHGQFLIGVREPDNSDKTFGRVYAFVAGRYPTAAAADKSGLVSDGNVAPDRAIAVAINIQSKLDSKGHVAAEFGQMLLDRYIIDRIFNSLSNYEDTRPAAR